MHIKTNIFLAAKHFQPIRGFYVADLINIDFPRH